MSATPPTVTAGMLVKLMVALDVFDPADAAEKVIVCRA
jgi:hypothetical protein